MNKLEKNMASHYERLAPALVALLLVVNISPALLVRAQEVTENPPAVTEEASQTETQTEPEQTTSSNDGEDGAPNESGEDGGVGEDGTSAQEPSSDGEPTVIDTGNASSGASGASQGNTTNISTENGTSTENSDGGSSSHHSPKNKQETTANLENNLTASSTASSTAQTGENTAIDPDGAVIFTGAAESFGYLISLFNIAIVNSSGSILFLRNPLGSALDFTQKIIDIFTSLAQGNGVCSLSGCYLTDAVFNLFSNNTLEVNNKLVVRSGTGGNNASSSGGFAGVNTGDARAHGGIINFGNLQIIDSRYLILLVTQEGDLAGDIILPDGDFFKRLSAGAALSRGSSVAVQNTADVTNLGTTTADTGSNSATGSSTEPVYVGTGNATSNASVMNFINQLGAPICFIVNVGGAWKGKVVRLPEGFSHESAPFGEIICGAGGAESSPSATNYHSSTTNYAKVLNQALVEAATGGNTAVGSHAAIETGNADAFLQILNVLNQTIIGQDWIFALFTVSGDWHGDLVFGSAPGEPDIIEEIITEALARSGVASGSTRPPDITLQKTAVIATTTYPAVVDYTITIYNKGGKAYDAMVRDLLYAPSGKIAYTHVWDLESIKPREEIVIKYSVEFKGHHAIGTYTNVAELRARKYRSGSNGQQITPLTSTASVYLGEGMVLGLSDCRPILTDYLRRGRKNSEVQVRALENFLNSHENESLAVDGIFDEDLEQAVMRFQIKYAKDVLGPWGLSRPTGHVYYTTRKKVNELYCEKEFPLASAQLAEIERYKKGDTALEALLTPAFTPIKINPRSFSQLLAGMTKEKSAFEAPKSQNNLFARAIENFFKWLSVEIFTPAKAAGL